MQADLAQREGTSTEELKRSLQHIGRSSIRATHTVNQLLALARAEGSGVGIARQPCDLAELTIEVVRDSVPRAMDKHIDLGYDGAEPGSPGVQLSGNPRCSRSWCATWWTTRSTTRRPPPKAGRGHGPRAGRHLWPGADAAGGRLWPRRARGRARTGLPALYRALGSEADGSGLGLPIVMEIAAKHHAEVLLEDAHPARTRRGALQCAVSGRRGRGGLTHPPTQRCGCP